MEARVAVIDADGCPLNVQVDGPEIAPVLMLSNSLGTDLHLWDDQLPAWSRHFRVVRYDRRGHGRSGFTSAPHSMERLGRDALAIMDALELDKVHWCGLSMGGMVGQWLAAHAPRRIGKLVLSNTSAYFSDKARWDDRIKAVRAAGVASVADAVMNLWFTAEFQARAPATVARMKQMLSATPPEGYVASCEAIRDMDHRELLPKITAPTLVIAGRHDRSTPLESAEFIRSRIPGAALTLLDAAHISNVEQPAAYTAEVLGFLTQP
jgi:3-oxoadipate enol-lactonase